jgi:hypothetical protein
MVINIIEATCRINIHFGEDTNQSSEDKMMESWVPTFVDLNDRMLRPLQVGASHAAGNSCATVVHVSPHELHVNGVLHSTIQAVSDRILSLLSAKDVMSLVCVCWEQLLGSSKLDGTPDQSEEFAWSMTMGRIRDWWPEILDHPNLQEAREIFRQLKEGRAYKTHLKYYTWTSVTASRLSGLRLGRTQDGEVELCNYSAQPGDIIAVLLGHDYPMLLNLANIFRGRRDTKFWGDATCTVLCMLKHS